MVDVFLFEQQFQRFIEHVLRESDAEDFVSFDSNSYTKAQEGYKKGLRNDARSLLKPETWKESDVGSGLIARSVVAAIELPSNNLVQWQSRYGNKSRPHHSLHIALESLSNIEAYESVLYSLYCRSSVLDTFGDLVDLFGQKYALIAYLLFLRDENKYMPIAPSYFDKAFRLLGVDFSTSRKCSIENYIGFNNILLELKFLLTNRMEEEVSLLDAHSFAWIISRTIEDNKLTEDHIEYLGSQAKERKAVIKARIGQGYFRNLLVNYWKECAVTQCKKISLLKASHIKPWSKCSHKEAIDPFNGLLLSPTFDAAFDAHLITFDNTGKILISEKLKASDAKILGISPYLRLSRIEHKHQHYLKHHRAIFHGADN